MQASKHWSVSLVLIDTCSADLGTGMETERDVDARKSCVLLLLLLLLLLQCRFCGASERYPVWLLRV